MTSNPCILIRRGNKRRIAERIIRHFPPHRLYVEPFFGAGGVFFAKSKAPYNLLNDIDEEVFNLFMVVRDRTDELVELWKHTPIHAKLFAYWRKHEEPDPVWRALRFLILSNASFLGDGSTMRVFNRRMKELFLERVYKCQEALADCEFLCADFRRVLHLVERSGMKEQAFVYCDPPYARTRGQYASGKFKEADTLELLDLLQRSGVRFAVSEFASPFILREAKRRKFRIQVIGDRPNLRKRRREVLLMNYGP